MTSQARGSWITTCSRRDVVHISGHHTSAPQILKMNSWILQDCDILADISGRQARSQLEQARGTSQRAKTMTFRNKVFSNLLALWLDYSKVYTTLNWQGDCCVGNQGAITFKFRVQLSSECTKILWENRLGTLRSSHVKSQKGYRAKNEGWRFGLRR